ncbi:MAG TPA: SDR family oxidoreductase [Salinarimonas sp.]|nr:SDR family oxidoreductase [Salinarimonas sp.]
MVERTGRGRTVLITGASSGIGAALARRLAHSGETLLLTARGATPDAEARLASVAATCQEAGADVATVTGDLAEEDGPARIAEFVARSVGCLHGLVSNAGFARRGTVVEMTPCDLTSSVRIAAGAFHGLLAGLRPQLAAAGDASVVAVSSFVAHRFGGPTSFASSAAGKAALEALVRSAAAELAPAGIRVNAVVPGYIRKDDPTKAAVDPEALARIAGAIPAGRLGTPDDVAGAIAYLLGRDSAYVTGHLLRVDGGLTLA